MGTEKRTDPGICLSFDSVVPDFVETFYMIHFIEGLPEVQKDEICLALSVDGARQFMHCLGNHVG